MDQPKEKTSTSLLIFLPFILLPLGQIGRLVIGLNNGIVRISFLDLSIFMAVGTLTVTQQLFFPKELRTWFVYLAVILSFNLGLSGQYLHLTTVAYLMRWFFYWLYLCSLWFMNQNRSIKRVGYWVWWAYILLGVGQYIFKNDLRSLSILGWDDHLGRLTSSLLDPGYAGAALGMLWLSNLFSPNWLLLVLLLLTYSRISYLALAIAMVFLCLRRQLSFNYLLSLIVGVLLLAVVGGEGAGVDLGRLFSVFSRWDNLREGFWLWTSSPLWGIGYNRLCQVRASLGLISPVSHACGGYDASVITLLVSTGLVGLIWAFSLLRRGWKILEASPRAQAVVMFWLIHALGHNSLFYAWLWLWGGILILLTARNEA